MVSFHFFRFNVDDLNCRFVCGVGILLLQVIDELLKVCEQDLKVLFGCINILGGNLVAMNRVCEIANSCATKIEFRCV